MENNQNNISQLDIEETRETIESIQNKLLFD